jgi:flagella basal body P-ring formation protein FlgA
MSPHRVVLLGLALLLAAATAADPAEPRALVTLLPLATVHEARVRLGDIAEIEGSDAELVARLRGIEVGRAPLPGVSRPIDLPYIRTRLRMQQVDLGALVLAGPPSVSVTAGAPLSDLVLPAGVLELRVRTPQQELTGSVAASVEAWVDGARVRSLSVPVRVGLQTDVLVAARVIPRHAVLALEDVRVERRELLAGQEPVTDRLALGGRRAVRQIAAGESILTAVLELPPLVQRGDRVLLVAEGRGVRAELAGEAREDGRAGQTIRVRNGASGREVYGQVEAAGQVRVGF